MKIALVLTDSSLECERALRILAECERAFSAQVCVKAVLEDLYRLQTAGISLGIPLPPNTVGSAKEKAKERISNMWRRIKEDEEARVETHLAVGELLPEVSRLVEDFKPDWLILGCVESGSLCGIVEKVSIPTLIIK